MSNRYRDLRFTFRLNQEERQQIEQRMADAEMTNMRAYLLQMALNGYVLKVELVAVREMVQLLTRVTAEVEEIIHKYPANAMPEGDTLKELQHRLDVIWLQTKNILLEVAKL